VLAPLITKRFIGNKEPKVLTGILIESACASVMVIPYILFIFGEMSLVSLPANLLVIPFIPLAMLLGLAAGLSGMLVPAVAGWLAWPAKWLLTYMLDVANILSRIPHAFAENIGFPLAYMIISYAAIGFVCLTLWKKTKQNVTVTEKIQE
ncbi:MAG TPA: ComEC/Rec2 family competence protein, partial [Nitrososphaera sp.]|nr:ComEC/Rec2 family competence protein [Nitrososphaera sp.]